MWSLKKLNSNHSGAIMKMMQSGKGVEPNLLLKIAISYAGKTA